MISQIVYRPDRRDDDIYRRAVIDWRGPREWVVYFFGKKGQRRVKAKSLTSAQGMARRWVA